MGENRLVGKIIALEGADAAGKGTQVALLRSRIEALGLAVAVYDFPRYETFFGQEIARYLDPGNQLFDKTDPFLMALLYAEDRLGALPQMREDLDRGCCLLLNRYVSSNLAHGAAKYQTMEEAKKFMEKILHVEYVLHRLPLPDLEIFLNVTSGWAARQAAIRRKGRVDAAEADLPYQERTSLMYRWLCENQPNWARIDCYIVGFDTLSREEIHEAIWDEVVKRGWS